MPPWLDIALAKGSSGERDGPFGCLIVNFMICVQWFEIGIE
jgi:hypothetical protein